MAHAPQVPEQLMEEIDAAHAAITHIREIAENAVREIRSDKRNLKIKEIIDTAIQAAYSIVSKTEILRKPFFTMKRMQRHGSVFPKDMHDNIDKTFYFPNEIKEILTNEILTLQINSDEKTKSEVIAEFVRLIDRLVEMEGIWKTISDYAKPVPQEGPHNDRISGGRKHRTYRKRTHHQRKHKRTHRRRTHRK